MSIKPSTQIDFLVNTKLLRHEDITEAIGVNPTRSFNKGDEYQGKTRTANGIENVNRVRPVSVWHYCTDGLVDSNSPLDHAIFILDKLSHAKQQIQRLCENADCNVEITIWYVGPGGFSMPSDVFENVAKLCNIVSITCWEDDGYDS